METEKYQNPPGKEKIQGMISYLLNCPESAHQLNGKNKICPNCGLKLSYEDLHEHNVLIELVIIVLVFITGIFVFLTGILPSDLSYSQSLC